MQKIIFDYEDDIINPCWDNVFKATFTRDTPESRGALEYLLFAIIGRKLAVTAITTNEPPVDDKNERQIRYDINCKFDDGELCNIEMTLNPDAYEPIRLEYYSSKLFVSQNIRGQDKSYSDLKHTYQISLLVNDPIIKDNEFVHQFQYFDTTHNIGLGGRTHIITLELSKLDGIAKKVVEEMTPIERWGCFFRYTSDKGKRELVNEIIRNEEGIAMAGQVLLTISKDEVERARLTSEYKYAVDLQSKVIDAKRQAKLEAAERALMRGAKPEDVAYDQDLPLNKVLEIKRKLS